jgi:hypothetical protein
MEINMQSKVLGGADCLASKFPALSQGVPTSGTERKQTKTLDLLNVSLSHAMIV